MTTEPYTLYIAPGACSRVAMVALEQCRLPYTTRRVALMQGEQRTPEYLALNPKGKVPLLLTPHGPLSENLAITQWLDATQPQAGLLPSAGGDAFERARAVSWQAFSATTLHPQLYRLRMTARIHADAATHEAIRATTVAEMRQQLAAPEAELADGRTWLMGSTWCMADAHLTWVVDRASQSGLNLDGLPNVSALLQRQMAQPTWQAMLAREQQA